jgi:hypothetical protein
MPGRTRRAIALGAALALAVPAAAQARDIYATDSARNLHRLDSRTPGVVLDTVAITGLPSGVSLVGIDIRPATGDLVGVGGNSVVYTINPGTGATTAVGTGFAPGLAGTSFGVDVNPVPDALRITSEANGNFRIAFATGTHGAGSPDGALNPGDPTVVASAYTNSALTATRPATTTLYAIDAASDQLLIQNPPNAGTLADGKPLGIDAGAVTGFDIAGAGNLGFLATVTGSDTGSTLYRVDIATGRTTELGPVATGSLLRQKGTPKVVITGIAARQELAAPKGNVPPNVSVVPTTAAPKANQRVSYIAWAADPDGAIAKVEWDTDGDGQFDDATGTYLRRGFPAGVRTLKVRVTDDAGARTATSVRVVIGR